MTLDHCPVVDAAFATAILASPTYEARRTGSGWNEKSVRIEFSRFGYRDLELHDCIVVAIWYTRPTP